ncbi:hypothetical protein BDW74DRAFT_178043 [Aspergillus multicolor]|uniref:uncharacterized protein n=1 Tax=Aspergillus multicolor TaxID=41759 RepID=UPI003CCCB5BA
MRFTAILAILAVSLPLVTPGIIRKQPDPGLEHPGHEAHDSLTHNQHISKNMLSVKLALNIHPGLSGDAASKQCLQDGASCCVGSHRCTPCCHTCAATNHRLDGICRDFSGRDDGASGKKQVEGDTDAGRALMLDLRRENRHGEFGGVERESYHKPEPSRYLAQVYYSNYKANNHLDFE